MTSAASIPETLAGRFSLIVDRLDAFAVSTKRRRPRRAAGDSYLACCPAHHDNNPSLSLRLEGQTILAHCFAGCTVDQVMESIDVPVPALFASFEPPPEHADVYIGKASKGVNGQPGPALHPSLGDDFSGEEGARLPIPPSVADFLAIEYPPIVPILGPIATQQINLLFAPTGAGKTMFGLAMSHAMAQGVDFIGWPSSGPRRVLYVDGEMAARMMQERLQGAVSERLFIANLPGWWVDSGGEAVNLTTEAAQALLSTWVTALGADVIVLDNFMSLAWRDGTSFSSDEIWTPFKRWCVAQRAAGKTVIMVDHANSQGTVFGTKTKTHIMDLVMVLEATDEDLAGEVDDSMVIQGAWIGLKFDKKRGFQESDPVVNQKEVQIGQIGQPWNHRVPVDPFLREILELRENGLTIREIAREMKVAYSKVQRTYARYQRA